MGNGKHSNAPLTPPIQKATFEKYPRAPKSTSQLRNVKTSLGSSLDQGLDKPSNLLVLSSRSKRICKSEESAIDAKHFTLPRETSSEETLDDPIFENERFVKVTNLDVIERDIEIITPVSVSKKKTLSDTTEDSASSKQRSSNSISSCEMALSGSQNDIEENSPNSSSSNVEQSINGDLISTDNSADLNKTRLSLVNNETDSKSLSSSESTANAYLLYDRDKSQETLTELGQKECNLLSKISINSEDTLSNSCASLDDKQSCNYDYKKNLPIDVCGASSYPENRVSDMAGLALRGYESDGK